MQPLALNKAFTATDPGAAVVMTTRDDAKDNTSWADRAGPPLIQEYLAKLGCKGIAARLGLPCCGWADHAGTPSSLAAMGQRGSLTDLHSNQPACSKSGAVHVEANDKAYTSEHRPAGEL